MMMMNNKALGLMDESMSMSNLTSTLSGETSISSNTNTNPTATATATAATTLLYAQQPSSSFASPNHAHHPPPQPLQPPPPKKKRSLPGNPDPDAEVIALSPKSLLATNRFICEICNKGFQRDQNLQLHRRGHNLPWKLKQRANKDQIRKKVYVCPEPTCVHHDSARALGDLTGIKKHYCRKHGEKKWKCDKCSKKYAVQSDWKAHSKICGTREYRCDCGTLFSRRDSFITHRAFCDALAEESARAVNPLSLPSLPQAVVAAVGGSSTTLPHHLSLPPHLSSHHSHHQLLHSLPLKREQVDLQQPSSFGMRPDIPSWLACPPPPPPQQSLNQQQAGPGVRVGPGPPQVAASQLDLHNLTSPSSSHIFSFQQYNQGSPSPLAGGPTLSSSLFQAPPPPQLSATALLQKAAEMGVTVSNHQQQQHHHQLSPHGIIEGHIVSSGSIGGGQESSSMLHDMMMMSSLQSTNGFDGSGFGVFQHHHHHHQGMQDAKTQLDISGGGNGGGNGSGNGGGDGLTRDFLGLRTFTHKDFLSMAGLSGHMNSSSSPSFDQQQHEHQSQTPW